MENQMLLENLDEKFEENTTVVTTKWLSINFDRSIGESQRILDEYLRKRSHLSAVYLLSGLDYNGQVVVKLVPQNKLNQAMKSFQQSPTKVLYSVQRNLQTRSSDFARNDVEADLSPDKLKRLTTIPWEPQVVSRAPLTSADNNQLNHVSQASQDVIQPREAVSKPFPAKYVQNKTQATKDFFTSVPKNKPNTTVATPQNVVPKRPSVFPQTRTENKPLVKSPVAKTVADDDDIGDDDDDDAFLTSAVISAKRKRLIVESDDESDCSPPVTCNFADSSTSGKIKGAPERKQAKVANKSDIKKVLVADSETDSPAASRSLKSRGEQNKERVVVRKTQKIAVTSPEPQTIGKPRATTVDSISKSVEKSPIGKPNRARRHVMKTFQDDEGFMVTEKAWESASEDGDEEEEEPKEQSKQSSTSASVDAKKPVSNPGSSSASDNAQLTAAPTIGTAKSKHPGIKKNQTALSKPASKQASLSSFFKRS